MHALGWTSVQLLCWKSFLAFLSILSSILFPLEIIKTHIFIKLSQLSLHFRFLLSFKKIILVSYNWILKGNYHISRFFMLNFHLYCKNSSLLRSISNPLYFFYLYRFCNISVWRFVFSFCSLCNLMYLVMFIFETNGNAIPSLFYLHFWIFLLLSYLQF